MFALPAFSGGQEAGASDGPHSCPVSCATSESALGTRRIDLNARSVPRGTKPGVTVLATSSLVGPMLNATSNPGTVPIRLCPVNGIGASRGWPWCCADRKRKRAKGCRPSDTGRLRRQLVLLRDKWWQFAGKSLRHPWCSERTPGRKSFHQLELPPMEYGLRPGRRRGVEADAERVWACATADQRDCLPAQPSLRPQKRIERRHGRVHSP